MMQFRFSWLFLIVLKHSKESELVGFVPIMVLALVPLGMSDKSILVRQVEK